MGFLSNVQLPGGQPASSGVGPKSSTTTPAKSGFLGGVALPSQVKETTVNNTPKRPGLLGDTTISQAQDTTNKYGLIGRLAKAAYDVTKESVINTANKISGAFGSLDSSGVNLETFEKAPGFSKYSADGSLNPNYEKEIKVREDFIAGVPQETKLTRTVDIASAALSFANLYPPIAIFNAELAAAKQLPGILSAPAKAVDWAFQKIGEVGANALGEQVDRAENAGLISPETAQTIRPFTEEVASFATLVVGTHLGFKAIEKGLAGDVVTAKGTTKLPLTPQGEFKGADGKNYVNTIELGAILQSDFVKLSGQGGLYSKLPFTESTKSTLSSATKLGVGFSMQPFSTGYGIAASMVRAKIEARKAKGIEITPEEGKKIINEVKEELPNEIVKNVPREDVSTLNEKIISENVQTWIDVNRKIDEAFSSDREYALAPEEINVLNKIVTVPNLALRQAIAEKVNELKYTSEWTQIANKIKEALSKPDPNETELKIRGDIEKRQAKLELAIEEQAYISGGTANLDSKITIGKGETAYSLRQFEYLLRASEKPQGGQSLLPSEVAPKPPTAPATPSLPETTGPRLSGAGDNRPTATLTSATYSPFEGVSSRTLSPEELSSSTKKGAVPSQDVFKTTTPEIERIKQENYILEGFYSDLALLVKSNESRDVIVGQMTGAFPELSPKEVSTRVDKFIELKPTEKQVNQWLDNRLDETVTISGGEQSAIVGSDFLSQPTVKIKSSRGGQESNVGGETFTAPEGFYKKLATKDMEKKAISINRMVQGESGKMEPALSQEARNAIYLDYQRQKNLGNLQSNKVISREMNKFEEEIYNTINDVISVEVGGKPLSAADWIEKRIVETTADTGDVVSRVASEMHKDTRFGDILRFLYDTPKFKGIKIWGAKLEKVTDTSGKDITTEFLKSLKSTKLERLGKEPLGAPFPKDLQAYVTAVIEQRGIPNPDVVNKEGNRTEFLEWRFKELQKEDIQSGKILEAMKAIPERSATLQRQLDELSEKYGEGTEIGKEPSLPTYGGFGDVPGGNVKPDKRTQTGIEGTKLSEADQRKLYGPDLLPGAGSPTKGTEKLLREVFGVKKGQELKETERTKLYDFINKKISDVRSGIDTSEFGKIVKQSLEKDRIDYAKRLEELTMKRKLTATKQSSLSPEEFRTKVDPEGKLGNKEFLLKYAQDGGFRDAQHFLNEVNKLVKEGLADPTSPIGELRARLSDTQIKLAYDKAQIMKEISKGQEMETSGISSDVGQIGKSWAKDTVDIARTPEELRKMIDPAGEMSDWEIVYQYSLNRRFKNAQEFLNDINTLASGDGQSLAARIRKSNSDSQIKEFWGIGDGMTKRGVSNKIQIARTADLRGKDNVFREDVSPDAMRASDAAQRGESTKDQTTATLIDAVKEPIVDPVKQRQIDEAMKMLMTPSARKPKGELPKGIGSKEKTFKENHPVMYQFANALGVPRAIMASGDVSAIFRQGLLMMFVKPGVWAKGVPVYLKATFNKNFAAEMEKSIVSDPDFKQWKDAGLSLSNSKGNALGREERFQTDLFQKLDNVPVLKYIAKFVEGSNRGYSTFSNYIRYEGAKALAADMVKGRINKGGDGILTAKDYRDTAVLVNDLTGRGTFKEGGKLEAGMALASNAFFAPRLFLSRMKILASPITYMKADPVLRKASLRAVFGLASSSTIIAMLASMAGADVEWDVRSTDWMKPKIGKTRIDILGGFQQIIRTFAQAIVFGEVKTAKGKIMELNTGKYGSRTRLDVVESFFINKASPLGGLIIDWLRGTDFEGQPFSVQKEILNKLTPMVIGDLIDLANEEPELLPLGILAALGFGVQTY